MQPAHAGEEEHGGERGPVDEGGPEVGLEEDEPHRHEAEADRGRDGPELTDPTASLDEEAGDRQHEEQLAELGRLELERPEVDPALRAAHRLGEDEDEDHHADRAAVEEPPVALVDRRRDQDRDEHAGDADRGGDRLPRHEVVRIARDVESRDPRDRPEAVADEGRDGEQQQPVEPPQDCADVEDAERRRPERRRAVTRVGDQSTFTRAGEPAFRWKNFSKTRSAAGAAADEP